MACRISELVLGCRDPELLARFWCEVLDFVVLDREDDGSLEIGPREGFGGPQPTIFLSRQEVPELGRPRLHLDVNATDRDQDAELERLLRLGARPADVGQTGQESWHVLADPEGNAFCLLRTRLAPLAGSVPSGGTSDEVHGPYELEERYGAGVQVGAHAARSCGSGTGRGWHGRVALGGTAPVRGLTEAPTAR